MRCFPYRKALDHLQAQGITSSEHGPGSTQHDPHPTLLALVGMIIRTGNEKEKWTTISILRRHPEAFTINNRQNAEVPKPKEREDRAKVFPRGDQPLKATPASVNSAQYTMILKELGDESGVAPKYSLEILSLDPPRFKATVSFRDITFESTARTKKEAKHQASRQACEHFGFKVV
jgi:Double-stranded RNA binding motif